MDYHLTKIFFLALFGTCVQFLCAVPTVSVKESVDSELIFESVTVGKSVTEVFQLEGLNLQDSVLLTITGSNADCFSVVPFALKPVAGTLAITDVTVTYAPDSENAHHAQLTITAPKTFPVTITLKGVGVSPSVNIDTESVATKIFARNGNVMVVTNAAQRIYLYDVLGQMLYTGITNIGENTIPVDNARMVIVKIDVKITKIVL
ncbi:MAG: hypothetical protein EOM76_01640 [Sphingobacteriia bacterium]|nr:hypothetical protein [Sphingobacteriia bacterium]